MIRCVLLPIGVFYLALCVAMAPVYIHKELRESHPHAEPTVEVVTEKGILRK